MGKSKKLKNASVNKALQQKQFNLIVHVFSEGETEIEYLKDIAQGRNVKVQIQVRNSTPRLLISQARNWAYENRQLLLKDKMRLIWVVFDDDEKVSELNRAVVEYSNTPKKYQKIKYTPTINVAYMKPCIELWGVVCMTGKAASLPQMHSQMEHKLKEIMPGYDHDGSPYFDIAKMNNTGKAIILARSWEKQFGQFPLCVGSASKFAGIYSLVEKILSFPQKSDERTGHGKP